jgi:hypothetical protein
MPWNAHHFISQRNKLLKPEQPFCGYCLVPPREQ